MEAGAESIYGANSSKITRCTFYYSSGLMPNRKKPFELSRLALVILIGAIVKFALLRNSLRNCG
jgi:hypothetical protein